MSGCLVDLRRIKLQLVVGIKELDTEGFKDLWVAVEGEINE